MYKPISCSARSISKAEPRFNEFSHRCVKVTQLNKTYTNDFNQYISHLNIVIFQSNYNKKNCKIKYYVLILSKFILHRFLEFNDQFA